MQTLIYSKIAIQAVKKGAAKSGSPTQNGQDKKVGSSQEMVVMVGSGQFVSSLGISTKLT